MLLYALRKLWRFGAVVVAAATLALPPVASAQTPVEPVEPDYSTRRGEPGQPNEPFYTTRKNPHAAQAEDAVGEPVVLEKAAYLGITSSPAPAVLRKHLKLPDGVGLVVDYVAPNGPAATAGVEAYDVMVRLNNQILVNPQQMAVLVRTFDPGTEITLVMIREMKETPVAVKLVEHRVKPLDQVGFGEIIHDWGAVEMPPPFVPPSAADPLVGGKLRPGNVVVVTIHDLEGPGLQTVKEVTIDIMGRIELPYLKEPIRASGLDEVGLQSAIIKAYRDEDVLEDAQVSVELKKLSPDAADDKPPSPQRAIRERDWVAVTLHNVEGPGVATVKQMRLDASGVIRLPGLAEPVPAAGLKVAELEDVLRALYDKAGLTGGPVSVSVSATGPSTKPSDPGR